MEGKTIKFKLKKELILSYFLIAFICVTITGFTFNKLIKKEFEKYVLNLQKEKSEDIITRIKNQYKSEGQWDFEELQNIGIQALEKGFIISIRDSENRVLWDANMYSSFQCHSIISDFSQNMKNYYKDWNGGYVENEYLIKSDDYEIGALIIGYYGPFFYNDSDIMFLNTLKKVLLVVGLIALILAVLVGILIAQRISKPISMVIGTAEDISKGKYSTRIVHKSTIEELNNLIEVVNNMANALEENKYIQKKITADVSHELRTPLTTLQGNLEAMIDGLWEPTKERLTVCHEEIVRLTRMTSDLEKLSYYEGKELILNKSYFNIYEAIKTTLINFEKEFINKDLDVKLMSDSENLQIYADRDKLIQAVINILTNSIKYTNIGDQIIISLGKVKNGIEISIKDTGIGIARQDIPYIFNRLYRVDKSRTRATGGSGLGLTITKSIIEAHNGEIYVKSTLNEGTEFKIEI